MQMPAVPGDHLLHTKAWGLWLTVRLEPGHVRTRRRLLLGPAATVQPVREPQTDVDESLVRTRIMEISAVIKATASGGRGGWSYEGETPIRSGWRTRNA